MNELDVYVVLLGMEPLSSPGSVILCLTRIGLLAGSM